MNLRDLSAVERAAARIDELVETCRPRGPAYCHARLLAIDVLRKAKGLKTSLAKLREALDRSPKNTPEEQPMSKKDPLSLRLYHDPVLYTVARLISYGGAYAGDLQEPLKPLAEKHGSGQVGLAINELTLFDAATGLTVLRPEVRKICRGLLGPAPESDEYADYWKTNGRTPPANHQPPVKPPEPKKKRTKKVKEVT